MKISKKTLKRFIKENSKLTLKSKDDPKNEHENQ
jgi:hypothetical protein